MSGPETGVAWLAPPGASFEEALAVGGDVRAALLAAGPRLPRKDLSRLYPATMQDAVSVVHARLEDNKKKAAASKQKSKSKSGAPHSPSDSHFPGARPGAGDPSAFWMYIEVRALGAGWTCACVGGPARSLLRCAWSPQVLALLAACAGGGERRRCPVPLVSAPA